MDDNQAEKTIRILETELYSARRTIIDLMSESKKQILMSFYECRTRSETYNWMYNISEKLIPMAEPLPRETGVYGSDRAYCPLCGEGSLSPYQSGYSLPEGLRRHLTGHGSTNRCVVTKVAYDLALDHWKDKFAETDQPGAGEG